MRMSKHLLCRGGEDKSEHLSAHRFQVRMPEALLFLSCGNLRFFFLELHGQVQLLIRDGLKHKIDIRDSSGETLQSQNRMFQGMKEEKYIGKSFFQDIQGNTKHIPEDKIISLRICWMRATVSEKISASFMGFASLLH